MLFPRAPFVPLCLFTASTLWTGCGQQYTRHVLEGYEKEKLTGKSFALIPMPEIQYQEPNSCMKQGSTDGSKYQNLWDTKILGALKTKHPKNRFAPVDSVSGDSGKIDYLALQATAEEAATDLGLTLIDMNQNNPLKVELAQKAKPKADTECRKLKALQFDYVIVPIRPKMHGEIHTTHNYGAGPGMAGGTSSQTVYYSDLQFVVFATETGEAIYASGVMSSSSGFCFVPPQISTVSGSGSELATRISDIVAKVLQGEKSTTLPVALSTP